jgi:hypothetical protein
MKATVITLTALILGGIAMARADATVLKVRADEPTDLYGGQASSVTGDIQRQAGDNFRWRGSGRLTWEVWVDHGRAQGSTTTHPERTAMSQAYSLSKPTI